MTGQTPEMVQITNMREAFYQAYHRQKNSLDRNVRSSTFRHLKSNAGRIYHRRGWFVTRSGE